MKATYIEYTRSSFPSKTAAQSLFERGPVRHAGQGVEPGLLRDPDPGGDRNPKTGRGRGEVRVVRVQEPEPLEPRS